MDTPTWPARRHTAWSATEPVNPSTVVTTVSARRRVGGARRVFVVCTSLMLGSLVGAFAQEAPRPGAPLSTFSADDFSGSGNCALCHTGLRDSTGQDVSIDTHWRSTMMANASKDPLWRAKMSAEVARNPALKAVIEDKCSTCHTPMARTQAVTNGSAVALLDDGFLNSAHPLHAAGADGVSCTLCHQIQNVDLGTQASFTGHYRIDTSTAPPNRLIHGPFVAPLQNQMRSVAGFTPVEGPHTLQSGLCATCHTLYTPTVDATGAVVGQLPEQTPYLEWEHSSYGDGAGEDRSCQQCHMPAAAGPAVISNRPGGGQLSPRSPFAQHYFVGANVFMLELLKTRIDELGADDLHDEPRCDHSANERSGAGSSGDALDCRQQDRRSNAHRRGQRREPDRAQTPDGIPFASCLAPPEGRGRERADRVRIGSATGRRKHRWQRCR